MPLTNQQHFNMHNDYIFVDPNADAIQEKPENFKSSCLKL